MNAQSARPLGLTCRSRCVLDCMGRDSSHQYHLIPDRRLDARSPMRRGGACSNPGLSPTTRSRERRRQRTHGGALRGRPCSRHVEPLVHLAGVLTHPLADDFERDLEIGEPATGDTREDGEDVVARELVAPEVEALAGIAAWVLRGASMVDRRPQNSAREEFAPGGLVGGSP